MTDFEKLMSVLEGKEEFTIKSDNEGKRIVFNKFGFSFDHEGNFVHSFNFKW